MEGKNFCKGVNIPAITADIKSGDIISTNAEFQKVFHKSTTTGTLSDLVGDHFWQEVKNGEPCVSSVKVNTSEGEKSCEACCTLMDNDHLFVFFNVCDDYSEADRRVIEQEARMKAFFDSGSFIFWTVNRKTALTSFNQQYSDAIFELYGVYPNVVKDENEPKKAFASEAYHSFWQEKYNEVFSTKKSVFFETATRTILGKMVFREIYLNPIINPLTNEIKEVAGMGLDVSKKKAIEAKAFNQSAKVETIFNATNQMIWSINRLGKITSFNDSFSVILSERFGEKPRLGESFKEYLKRHNISHSREWLPAVKSLLNGKSLSFEIVMRDLKGVKHVENVSLAPIYDHKLKIVEIAGISQTITYRKTAEQKLKEQAAKINAIFNSTAMSLWTLDNKRRIVSFNDKFAQQYYELLGEEISIGSDFMAALKRATKEKPFKNLQKMVTNVFKGKNQQFEGMVYDNKGNRRWLESFYNPIYSDDNSIKEIACLSFEITDKKIIEAQMMENLKEKEVLLQEVHHRVKNNLQIISSILNLQSSYIEDDASLNILRESQNRIKSMSFIHESLYHTKNFSKIEFSSYILSLASNLIHTYNINSSKIEIRSELDNLFLELDQAIPCGLIANELISNAIKYAFADIEHGEIYIRVKLVDQKVRFEIGDNGVGLPRDFDYTNSHSLGLQLVCTLADQLDAEIEVDTEGGTKFLITFEQL